MLCTSFLEPLPDELRLQAQAVEELASRLTALYYEGQRAWEGLLIAPRLVGGFVGQTIAATPPSGELGLRTRLERLQAADLYLAAGCFFQDELALARFEEAHLGLLRGVVRRHLDPRFTEDDLLQLLREKLFVGSEEAPPRIVRYAGEGPLSSWLRITATRTCLDKLRRGVQQKREHGDRDTALYNAAALDDDIELGFLKREYRGHFADAIELAFGRLESSHRHLLRQQLLHGLSIDQIGALYHIHRSTAARRLAKARQQLLAQTRDALIHKLKISDDEFESIMHLIQSRLDLSIQRLLQSHHAETSS